jgi:hypothetical protein
LVLSSATEQKNIQILLRNVLLGCPKPAARKICCLFLKSRSKRERVLEEGGSVPRYAPPEKEGVPACVCFANGKKNAP